VAAVHELLDLGLEFGEGVPVEVLVLEAAPERVREAWSWHEPVAPVDRTSLM
jgi:hypothetical protein